MADTPLPGTAGFRRRNYGATITWLLVSLSMALKRLDNVGIVVDDLSADRYAQGKDSS